MEMGEEKMRADGKLLESCPHIITTPVGPHKIIKEIHGTWY